MPPATRAKRDIPNLNRIETLDVVKPRTGGNGPHWLYVGQGDCSR